MQIGWLRGTGTASGSDTGVKATHFFMGSSCFPYYPNFLRYSSCY
jgi:hypothetical protein